MTNPRSQQKWKLPIKTDLGSLNSTNTVVGSQRCDFLLSEGSCASFLGLIPRVSSFSASTSTLSSKGRLDTAEQELTDEKPRNEDPKESLWSCLGPPPLPVP